MLLRRKNLGQCNKEPQISYKEQKIVVAAPVIGILRQSWTVTVCQSFLLPTIS